MQPENQSLVKLRSIARFLKLSGRFYFQNYNLKLFLQFLEADPEIAIIINSLIDKYPELQDKFNEHPGDIGLQHANLNVTRSSIDTFDKHVAFCISYLRKAVILLYGNSVVDCFIQSTGRQEDRELPPKEQFYNDCIEPILIYLELQINRSANALYTLKRYKVLCEWFDRQTLLNKQEIEITRNHLSKYLFDCGFTYSLSETMVPSGRIDNFAINFGLSDKTELANLPNAIIAEAKIFRTRRSIQEVFNQVDRRMRDLGFHEGYCVIINKTNQKIVFSEMSGDVDGIFYKTVQSSKIYFLVINLHDNFYESTITIREVLVDVNFFNSN